MELPVKYKELGWQERRAVREQYIQEQQGKCHHCGSALSDGPPHEIGRLSIDWRRFPKNFMQHPVHLHHDHGTGLTIGAVHAKCNAVLWQYHGE